MARAETDDVFRRLELVVDKMKKENVFRKKKPEPKHVPEKKISKKRKSAKKSARKAPQKKMHEVLGIPKIHPQNRLKLRSKPFIALVKKHHEQKTKSRIENAILATESHKLKNSEDFGKLGLKRIITREKSYHAEPVESMLTEGVVSIEENEKVARAIELMLQNDIRGLAVTSKRELKGAIESEDIVKRIEKTEPSQVQVLMSRPVKEMTRPAETIAPKETFGNVMQKMNAAKANRLFVIEDQKPVSVVSKADILKRVSQTSSVMGMKIETGIDKLLELVEQKGKISTEDASKALKVDAKLVEEWASILDDHNLIKIEYPIIGTIELIKK
ncbi:MAG: CBS domain-containing protein [Candidatus Nanoarchaeia archaeon]|nr:CBS domain-containing protein [Candidatus Nanoarchaeia archaeon]MDD5239351.1 CBS domain-containing protein [Candidatus Nanoarchaeia archaeon]